MPVVPTCPGVYVDEVSSGVRTIGGVSTSVTAFVGRARRGPVGAPARVFGSRSSSAASALSTPSPR